MGWECAAAHSHPILWPGNTGLAQNLPDAYVLILSLQSHQRQELALYFGQQLDQWKRAPRTRRDQKILTVGCTNGLVDSISRIRNGVP